MAVPQLTPLPDPPSSEMTEAVFNEHADASLVGQKTMVIEYNGTVLPWVAQQLADTQSARDAGVTARNAAQQAQQAAEQAAEDATENGAAQVLLAKNQADAAKGSADAAKASETEAGVYASLAQSGAALPVTADKDGYSLVVNPGAAGYELKLLGLNRSTVSGNGTLGKPAHRALVDVAGTITLTFASAALLRNGFFCYLRNVGTGVVTVAAAAGQTIDGLQSGQLRPGMALLVQCDGAALHCIRVGPAAAIEVLTSGTSWTVPLGVRSVRAKGDGGGTGGGSGINVGSYTGGCGGAFEALIPVSPGQVITYAVGSGGAGAPATSGSATAGSIGGTTSVTAAGVTYMAYGGEPQRLGGYASGPAGTLLKRGSSSEYQVRAMSPHGVSQGGDRGAQNVAGSPGTAGAISFEY